MLRARGVKLLAIDEAHCVSAWGHDFRPAYMAIAKAAEALGRPPILALTATATSETAADIVRALGLRAPLVVRTSVVRPNLAFHVERTVNEMAKRVALLRLFDDEPGPGIVYTATVKKADELYRWTAASRIPVARYHGRMSAADRERSRAHFMDGTVRVMIATKAFGMGIDKPDTRFVVHYQVPDSIESYAQEAGRAGRDGRSARCVLLYRLEDKSVQTFFIARKYATRGEIAKVVAAAGRAGVGAGERSGDELRAIALETGVSVKRVDAILGCLARLESDGGGDACGAIAAEYERRRTRDAERLAAMLHYAQSTQCRRVAVAEYFGEAGSARCGRCDACNHQPSRSPLPADGGGSLVRCPGADPTISRDRLKAEFDARTKKKFDEHTRAERDEFRTWLDAFVKKSDAELLARVQADCTRHCNARGRAQGRAITEGPSRRVVAYKKCMVAATSTAEALHLAVSELDLYCGYVRKANERCRAASQCDALEKGTDHRCTLVTMGLAPACLQGSG